MRVLLVDDLTTDGGSKVAFTRGLRSAGATVTDALSLFYHGTFPGAAERLAGLGLRLHALATWRDVLAVGRADTAVRHGPRGAGAIYCRSGRVGRRSHGGRTTPIAPSLRL